jgi:hypothetical protein
MLYIGLALAVHECLADDLPVFYLALLAALEAAGADAFVYGDAMVVRIE